MADTTTDGFKEIIMQHPDNGSQQAVSDIADFQRLSAFGWTEAKASTKSTKSTSTKSSAKTADSTPTTNAEAAAADAPAADAK